MKKVITIIITFLLFLSFSLSAIAHPGKTDAQGGHYDWSTGEYHFHHGFPAHQHENGVCPYDYIDRTRENSGSSSSGSSYTRQEPESFEEKPSEDHTYQRTQSNQITRSNSTEIQSKKINGTKVFAILLLILLFFFLAVKFVQHIQNNSDVPTAPELETTPEQTLSAPDTEPPPSSSDYAALVRVLCSVGLKKIEEENLQRRKKWEAAHKRKIQVLTADLSHALFYPNGKLKTVMPDEEYEVNRGIAAELFSLIDISFFIPDFPPDISINYDDTLIFNKADATKQYGDYTGYQKSKNTKIHLYNKCGNSLFGFYDEISILGAKQSQICKQCLKRYGKDLKTNPEWYLNYRRIKRLKDFYRINK